MSSTPRSTRREFLQGQAAADALAHLVTGDGPASGETLPEVEGERYLVRVARRAMACDFEVFLNAGQYSQGTEAAVCALDLIDVLEDQLSVYRDHSELSRLNRMAAFHEVTLEARLFDLLLRAQQLHAETDGAYDVTAGRLSEVWGFKRRQGRVPPDDELVTARACLGSQYLQFDPTTCGVRFLQPGLEINLGSIGKGYALDRAAEQMADQQVGDFLLHGGNSSVLARGSHAAHVPKGWRVGVRNPLRPQERLGYLWLKDRALATSGSGTQFFTHQGRRLGHILDPRTGWPAEGVLTASVVAPTAAVADALSTAFYVLGPTGAAAYCARHSEVSALLICPGSRAGSLEIHRMGLADDDWMELPSADS